MLKKIADRFGFEGAKVLVTEVTRMKEGKVCVAGIDLATGSMIRPLQQDGGNWEELKWVESDYFAPGNVVGLQKARTAGRDFPHANEDCLISTVSKLGVVDESELFVACDTTADVSIDSVLSEHVLENKYVEAGAHCRSLFGITMPANIIRLSDRFNRMQLSFPSDQGWYNLPVTDLKAKEAGDASKGIKLLQDRIDAATSHVAIRLGLAREWDGPDHDYHPKRCYIQVNGLVVN